LSQTTSGLVARTAYSSQEGEPEQAQHQSGGGRKTTWIVLGLVIMFLLVGGAVVYFLDLPGSQSSGSGFQMTLDGAKVASSNNIQIVLNVTLGLHNTGPQDVTFDGALYSLSANANQQIGRAHV